MKKAATTICVGIVAAGVTVAPLVATAENAKSPTPEIIYTSIPGETKKQHDARIDWWREAKFGMFIHWGLYSVLGGEYDGKKSKTPGEGIMMEFKIPKAEYAKHAKDFTCSKFDADEYVKLAKAAGMKYIVYTAKHAEGFAMFRTKTSPFNICDATPFQRDPLKELSDACRKHGMPLGFYYTQSKDTLNDGFGNNWDKREKTTDQYFDTVSIPQIKDLLSNYGEYPAIFWWDAPDGMTSERAKEITGLVKTLKPGCIMDDRLGGSYPGDFKVQWWTPQQVQRGDWERHVSMNFGSWGFIKNNSNCSTDAKGFLGLLIDAASKGGNFILNVTPDAEGRIPKAQVECLTKIGQWLHVNGEAIYGTTATTFGAEFGSVDPEKKDKHGKPEFNATREWRCTAKPGKLYIHIFQWPAAGKFELPAVKDRIVRVYLLADPKRAELKVTQTDARVSFELPTKAPDPITSVLCLELNQQQP